MGVRGGAGRGCSIHSCLLSPRDVFWGDLPLLGLAAAATAQRDGLDEDVVVGAAKAVRAAVATTHLDVDVGGERDGFAFRRRGA